MDRSRFGWSLGAIAPWWLGVAVAVSMPADAGQDLAAGASLAPLSWRAPQAPSDLIPAPVEGLAGALGQTSGAPYAREAGWRAMPRLLREASLAIGADENIKRIVDEIEPRISLKRHGEKVSAVDRGSRGDPDVGLRPAFDARLRQPGGRASWRAHDLLFDQDEAWPTGAFENSEGDLAGPDQRSVGVAALAPPPETLALASRPGSAGEEMRCLAEAIYFEARGESEEGQAAVAQVVMNRVSSGLYPETICGVVYQNRRRRDACQFSFACDGMSLRVTEPESWRTAQRIAAEVAAGATYVPDVGGATHYHAAYTRPRWARSLEKMDVIGHHIFYSLRPGQT
jgi:hypothetical protein